MTLIYSSRKGWYKCYHIGNWLCFDLLEMYTTVNKQKNTAHHFNQTSFEGIVPQKDESSPYYGEKASIFPY